MIKTKKNTKPIFLRHNLLPVFLFILLIALGIFAYHQILEDKFYPLTFAGDTNISFLTKGEAVRTLQAKFQKRSQEKLSFIYPQGSFTIDLATVSAEIDYSNLDATFYSQHSQTPLLRFKTDTVIPKITLSVEKQLDIIAYAVNKAPVNAQLLFDESTGSAQVQIKEAENGLEIDREKINRTAQDFLIYGKYNKQLSLRNISPKITTDRVIKAKEILEKSLTHPVKLTFDEKNWTIDTKQLLTLLDLTGGGSATKGKDNLLSREQTITYLSNIASEIDQEVQESLFEFNPGTKRVTAFKPSKEGRKLNTQKAYELITNTLNEASDSAGNINLPVDTVAPKIATSDVNSLGIKELLGRGVSNFAGSITNRIYNINLAASRINGVLIAPGQTFSFNQTVGDITEATGFKKAYVIKEGRTVLDDGGGVCQVSTTLFRAVLNSGLPVVKRTAHAYRVSYYEQGFPPGLDATVFYPSVDFQFKNDTGRHILLQAYTSGTTIYIDLYGTSDGRTVSLTRPVITNSQPPPPELRQDDPTLPKGTVKQVDWAAWGATVTFNRTVTRNGETLANETWKSNFKPWQAVYLVGTQ